MKQIKEFITEKFKVNSKKIKSQYPIYLLIDIFNKILLKENYDFKEEDFKDFSTGMYEIKDINNKIYYQEKYFENFIKDVKSKDNNIFQYYGEKDHDGELSIGIKGQNETCITFNFVKSLNIIVKDIQNIYISKDIKDILLDN